MRLLVILLLGTWLGQPLQAQTLTFHEKEAFANQVLERIGAAYGFDVLGLPKLVVYPKRANNRHIAHLQMIEAWLRQPDYSLYRSRLIMDEALFDLCAAIDKKGVSDAGTALAFVLSHEMAHFYHRHATFRSFADQKSAPMPEKISIDQESQADQTGLLFAYMAGFDPEPVLEQLFNSLYTTYQLADKLWGYPTKADRQHTTRTKAVEFRNFGNLFAVGHALYCHERFPEAARCFEYVFTRYPLKEAFNNFGVCRLQQLIRSRKKDALSYFAFPFEVDPRNRLLQMGERSGLPPGPEQATWIKDADIAFGRAIGLDAAYRPAYLNQAQAALLSTNAFLSIGILTNMTQKTSQPLPPNGYLIQGMAYSALGDWPKANQNFSLAVKKGAFQAHFNGEVAQLIRTKQQNAARHPLPKPLQRKSDQSLGCQTGGLLLQEVNDPPAAITWSGNYLMELSTPRPFITIESERTKTDTFFRVKLGRDTLYFDRPHRLLRKGR
ncbi:hypothetical protein [Fibrella forsythiae]|uniref:Tetratricopeptide repeat protein n=1 Tax=Fibrella forsythiae TaxID=2817061 RepID=A0ABS3JPR2_9BACT|nr:hypothetical protein [Fibrella forsythiae]MBO0950912.1 hypothetical protein [Fibrella forsythiae]